MVIAIQFLKQYFSEETQGSSHPALTVLNRLCTATENLLVEVGITIQSIFSAPEQKAQLCVVRHLLFLTFHIFDFSSETTEQNSTKLDRKQDLNVIYQVFLGWLEKQDGHPGMWLAEADFSS